MRGRAVLFGSCFGSPGRSLHRSICTQPAPPPRYAADSSSPASDLGQLGSALPAGPTASPLTVSGLPASPVAALCAGSSHTCVLTAGGGVACWGWNYNGQLGDGTNTSRPNPAMVTGLSSGVVEIACGGEATCARLAAGSVECWGSNYQDSLGDGMGADTNTPGSVLGL